jgi:hypothetical protein
MLNFILDESVLSLSVGKTGYHYTHSCNLGICFRVLSDFSSDECLLVADDAVLCFLCASWVPAVPAAHVGFPFMVSCKFHTGVGLGFS